MSRKLLSIFSLAALVLVVGCSDDDDPTDPVVDGPTSFTLTIKNISDETPLAPGVWAVSTSGTPLFDAGQADRGTGLEALAEDGMNGTLAGSIGSQAGVVSSGAFGTGGIGMDGTFTATFEAEKGQALSFATMYVESNDLFFSPNMSGINLFNGDDPISGDITEMVFLYDGGTEVNQEPGSGSNQPMRQSGPNTGADEGLVQLVGDIDGYTYPAVNEMISATLSSSTDSLGTLFTVRIDNMSTAGYPIAPGAWAVHTGANPIFTSGSPDMGMGLEPLAEDGMNGDLVASLPTANLVVSSGGFGAGGQGPDGEVYEFSFLAEDGQKLSFVTMFVPSNDLFYAPSGDGIALFDGGAPLGDGAEMDITSMIEFWDAGTEVNEAPAGGMHQPPNGGGTTEGVVQVVMDGFTYGDVDNLVEVTLTVN